VNSGEEGGQEMHQSSLFSGELHSLEYDAWSCGADDETALRCGGGVNPGGVSQGAYLCEAYRGSINNRLLLFSKTARWTFRSIMTVDRLQEGKRVLSMGGSE